MPQAPSLSKASGFNLQGTLAIAKPSPASTNFRSSISNAAIWSFAGHIGPLGTPQSGMAMAISSAARSQE